MCKRPGPVASGSLEAPRRGGSLSTTKDRRPSDGNPGGAPQGRCPAREAPVEGVLVAHLSDPNRAAQMTTLELIEVAEGRWLAVDCCTAASIGSTFTGLPTGPAVPTRPVPTHPVPAHPRSGGAAAVGSPAVGSPSGSSHTKRSRRYRSILQMGDLESSAIIAAGDQAATRRAGGDREAGAVNRCRVCGASLEGGAVRRSPARQAAAERRRA